MPGRARMYIAGLPYHIVQPGNNRKAHFLEPENYQYYINLWKVCSKGSDFFVQLLNKQKAAKAAFVITNNIYILIGSIVNITTNLRFL